MIEKCTQTEDIYFSVDDGEMYPTVNVKIIKNLIISLNSRGYFYYCNFLNGVYSQIFHSLPTLPRTVVVI